MKSTHRRTATAVGLFALSLMGVVAPVLAQGRGQAPAQRGGVPNPETPQILVATFASPQQQLGVEVGDEVRSRLQGEHSAKELYVVTKTNINNALTASGYRPDSALNASDLMELARITHGDFVLDGKVNKNGNTLHVETRILTRTGTQTVSQPLPPVDGKDPGDVAKMLERNITDALKQMPSYKLCINDLRAQKFDQAIKDGTAALAAYANSSLARLCLLQAYDKLGQTDSVISTANAILAKDSTSQLALVNLVDAWSKKGDKEKAIEYNIRIWRLDPTNVTTIQSIVNDLANSGAPDRALPMIDTLLIQNPADPAMLRTKWLLQLKLARWKQAIATGEELAKADTALAATVDFHNRMVGAAQSDSNPPKIIELASKASQKFPKDVSFQNILALNYRKVGQLQQALAAATRATELDPKNSNAWLLAVATAKDLNQVDTAAALATRGIKAGADKATLEPFLLGPVSAAVNKAQTSHDRGDWETALAASQKLDATNPAPATKFFVGYSSFSIGLMALQNAGELGKVTGKDAKDAHAKACAEAKLVEDMWAIAQTNILPGGQFNKEGAGQVMAAIQQYSEYIPQMKKSYCTGK